jgi:U3 small nucleolar RNA-associated protein 4
MRYAKLEIGPDAAPNILPLARIGFEHQRALPFLPQDSIIQSSSKKRLMMSWWDREVLIWRLGKFAKSAPTSEDEEEEQASRPRKLVAKILIKGESNITSTSLNRDGNLLAVATAEEIKLFHLRNKKTEDALRVSKIYLPSSLAFGARLIQFSPNGKWLCIVRSDSRVVTARVVSENLSTISSFTVHPKVSKLRRIDRGTPKMALLGGLGSYDRTVTKVAFSPDSNILVVSDLAGYIDSFVLSGEEDLSEDPSLDEVESSSDSSDSENSSDEEGEEDTAIIPYNLVFGQQWIRNPSASSIPRLPSTPTILSFRPDSGPTTKPVNGLSPHPTRNNPHPISRAIPTSATTPDRLFIMTSCASIFEFNVLSGSLSSWSRRNPSSVLPEDFRRNKDHARGCFWNVTEKQCRLWLYGVAWIWMFDLNRDFQLSNDTSSDASKKRKRIGGKEFASGAGDAISKENLGIGISRKVQKVAADGKKETREEETVDPLPFDGMDLDSDAEGPSALELLRRGSEKRVGLAGKKSSWHTYKYRPILGVVALGEEVGEAGIEVAIVERPIWEVELPPRYYGDQEWEQKGVS